MHLEPSEIAFAKMLQHFIVLLVLVSYDVDACAKSGRPSRSSREDDMEKRLQGMQEKLGL